MLAFLVTHKSLQTIVIAKKLPFAEWQETARTDDPVLKCDGIDSQLKLTVTFDTHFCFGIFFFHDVACEPAVIKIQPIRAISRS